MPVITIAQLLEKFGPGDAPRSDDYIDLIDTLADDRNAVYFDSVAPADTDANPLWFNTSSNALSVYNGGQWVGIQGGGAAVINAISPLDYTSGDLSIDLSAYETTTEIDTRFTSYDTSAEVDTKIANLVDSAPSTLDTLNELASALGDDPNFATTITNQIAGKANTSHTHTASEITDFDSAVDARVLNSEEAMIVALTDEVSEVTTGTSKVSFRFPFDATLYQVPRASLSTASNASTAVDINKNGASILSTKLSIDASEKTSASAASSAVLSTTSISSDDELTFDVDSAGNNGVGLKVTLFYKKV